MTTKKFWMLWSQKNDGKLERFETLQDARDEAARRVGGGSTDVFIMEAVEVARQPIPSCEIVGLT